MSSQMGAGRAETKDPRLRRCGYGVAWIFSDGGLLNTQGGRAGILHGRTQSVARAELLAAVEALRLSATQQFSSGPIVCSSSTVSPEGGGGNT